MHKIISKMKETKSQERLIALGLFVLLMLLLIPVLWISKYNVMGVDDYRYLNIAQNGLIEEYNIFSVLITQAQNAIECWKTWQGQYFANWSIMTFLALGGGENYFLVTFVTLIPLLFADYLLAYVILKKGFNATLSQVSIAILPVMIFHLSAPPSLVEAFYWLSGAITYTTVYAMSLVSIALLTNLLFTGNKWKMWVSYAVVLLISVCLGGGNFVTGLFMLLVFSAFSLYAFARKHKQRVFYFINLLTFTTTFLITIFSPGATSRRIENAESQVSAIKAVIMSLVEAGKYIYTWTLPFVILLAVALIPLFWKIIKKKNYRFPFPALVLLISFGMYAAQFTPNQYALGILGAYRVQNIYRFQMILLLLGNEFYILGYLHRCFPALKFSLFERMKKIPFIVMIYGTLATCIVFLCMYNSMGSRMSSVSTYESLRDGTAAQYYQEYQERLAVLEDDSVKDVVFEPYTYHPYALFFYDFQSFHSWINEYAEQFYNKNSILVRE